MSAPSSQWSEEQIQAFVDGELAADLAVRLEVLGREDPELAGRIARQRALRARLAHAFDPVLDEAVPARLLQALEGKGGAATPIGAARRSAPKLVAPRPLWWSAAAAGVVVAALLGWFMPRDRARPLVAGSDGLLAAGPLANALSRRIAADGPEDGVLVSLSFRAGDGRYCRAFTLDSGIDGLACRHDSSWQVEALGRSPAADAGSDEYRQASSGLSLAVLAAISSRQAGDVLTPQEERHLRDGGWR